MLASLILIVKFLLLVISSHHRPVVPTLYCLFIVGLGGRTYMSTRVLRRRCCHFPLISSRTPARYLYYSWSCVFTSP
ncbi:hypothetical protein B0H11DRAFT_2133658 [Mycena galericulata]|nr:hypothetical protein B0H11DRAFT_2133658 [Mycena galericulata]